ncbi:carotenoid biosynthesis protein [Paenibacillus sp. Marseille-Q4541]|uniref:carotenoid biosynthesis protein n=1 Tax=Paenibacillus sp. Marseille-Q4541 TaxID=2831522 RepID=UPI001BA4E90B|nr:carotenoid biosynthesis protein [Paenibacillus sp. Marseille-Q4541]
MIQLVYWIWYSIGAVLLLTIGVPDALSFSNGLFLILYALSAIDLIFRNYEKNKLSDRSVRWWREPLMWLMAIVIWTGGMAVEWVGVHTGWPFGAYTYSHIFGPHLFAVPFTLGFAWIAVVGNSALLSGGGYGWKSKAMRAMKTGAWALMMDLVLDPVAHHRGFWNWEGAGGFYGVPWTNFISWFVMGGLLSFFIPPIPSDPVIQRRGKTLYQMFILLFGLLAVQAGLYGSGMIAALGILLAEGRHQYAVRKQVSAF